MNLCQYSDFFCKLFKSMNANDFSKGYACGVGMFFIVLLILIILLIIIKIIFRRRRCSEIIAPSSDGDVTISVSAIEDTVRAELNNFPSVKVNKIRLYRIRKKYQINLVCEYDGKEGGLPDITQKMKKAISDMAVDFFGISSIRKINLKFERLSRDKALIITTDPAAETSPPVPVSTITPVSNVKTDDSNDDIF